MTITGNPYVPFLVALGQGALNLSTDPVWVALFTSDYTPDFINDSDYFNLRGSCEMADQSGGTTLNSTADYSWNGQQLESGWNYYSNTQAVGLYCANVTWSSLTGTFRYAIVYKWTAQTVDNIMIGCVDFGADQTYAAQPFTLEFANGVFTVVPSTVTV